jgi:ABC-type multidrug transport system fused ATPase/permease subunit
MFKCIETSGNLSRVDPHDLPIVTCMWLPLTGCCAHLCLSTLHLDRTIPHLLYNHIKMVAKTTPNDPELLAIDCQDLRYTFEGASETVLSGIDLQLKQGDRCLLVGANGGVFRCSSFALDGENAS